MKKNLITFFLVLAIASLSKTAASDLEEPQKKGAGSSIEDPPRADENPNMLNEAFEETYGIPPSGIELLGNVTTEN